MASVPEDTSALSNGEATIWNKLSGTGSMLSGCFTAAGIVTAIMLTRQTRIMGRGLQIQEDNIKLLERQVLAGERQNEIAAGLMRSGEKMNG